ncbi:MAG TPA: radical SAM protein [bacterium]|nr:radical SAM protein [bacterium]
MFHPEEAIFAPTGRCNLHCSHCRVSRGHAELPAADAIRFLDSCVEGGIERIGFSGGEPFLRLDFLIDVSRAAVERGLYFDRLMTNGDWWLDEASLRSSLAALYAAGFDGIIGVSYDTYHGQSPERMASFLKAVFETWGRKDAAEILSVRSDNDKAFMLDLGKVARSLGGRVEYSDERGGEPARISDSVWSARDESSPDDGAGLVIQIVRSPRSRSATEDAWKADTWFIDDYCAGPGNVFYVHPDGSIAVCCGFANENSDLIVGTVADSYNTLMKAAGARPKVCDCYDTGLATIRKRLEAEGVRFPGKTDDICFFCDYVSTS